MAQCPQCGKEGYTAKTAAPSTGRPVWTGAYKAKPVTYNDTAFVLEKHEKCKPEWEKFLREMRGKDGMSEKQWKFYCVIHKECLGTWPKENPGADLPALPGYAKESAAQNVQHDEPNEIPF